MLAMVALVSGRAFAAFVVGQFFPAKPIPVVVDGTVDEYQGKEVYGKACRRNAVLSDRSFAACLCVYARRQGRRPIEAAFEDMRAYIGFEAVRGRSKNTVLCMVPCLLGLHSVAALICASLSGNDKRAERVK